MKKMKFLPIAIVALVVIMATSCSKPVEDNLPGTWNMESTISFLELRQTFSSTATFKDDGTASFTTDGETENITWSSTKSTVTFAYEDGSDPITFDIETNKKDEQEWRGTITESADGTTYSLEVTVKLTK
jgi:uncharacterized protein (DUF2147 family)